MFKNRKRIVASLLALSLAGSMAACGGSSGGGSSSAPAAAPDANAPAATEPQAPAADAGGKQAITFWHAMGGVNGEAVDLMVKNFNDSSDKYVVTAQYQGTYDDELTKLKTSMQSGVGPDLCQVYDIGSKYMVDTGYIVPMQDMIDKDGEFNLSDIEPNCVNYYSVGGKLQSMPFNSSTPMLYINKDAFKEAGLDPEQPPKNFDELLQYAEKLTVKDGDRVVRHGFAMAIYGWFFEQLIATQGQLYADNDNGRTANATAVAFDSNGAGLKVVQSWKSLLDSGFAGNFGRKTDDTQNAFIAGKVAMIFESTAIIKKLNEGVGGRFEIGAGYLPHIGDSAEGGVIIGGGCLWIIDNKDDAKKDGAWQFVKYAASPEAQANWNQGTGYFCVNSKAYELDVMKDHLAKNPMFQIAIDQLHASPTNAYTQGALLGVFSEARATFEENMENVVAGSATPEDCIAKTASSINSAIENYNATTAK